MRTVAIALAATFSASLSIPAPAATLSAVDFRGGYQVRIEAEITADTSGNLLELIRERGGFPTVLVISSDEGDAVGGMALGRFIRAAMLRISAGRSCGDACILAWAGGVARSTTFPLQLSAENAADSQIADYLAEMDATLPGIAGANREPAAHAAWLAERCGVLTETQQSDLAAIRALQALEASLEAMATGGMGSQSNYTVDEQTQRDAARAQGIPEERRTAVSTAQEEIDDCRGTAIAGARKRLLE